jgi:hypothetical protein
MDLSIRLQKNNEPKYVLKLDRSHQITLVEQLLHAYRHATLFPMLLYTDPAKTFIVYAYIKGTISDVWGRVNVYTI